MGQALTDRRTMRGMGTGPVVGINGLQGHEVGRPLGCAGLQRLGTSGARSDIECPRYGIAGPVAKRYPLVIGSSLSTPGRSGVGREDDCVALGLPRDQLSPRC